MNTFNVIRLNQNGPQKNEVWIVPNCRKEWSRLKNGQACYPPFLKAQLLLGCVSWDVAFWFSRGLLQGEGAKNTSPHVKAGKAKHWDELNYDD